jgi:hypothetical protein
MHTPARLLPQIVVKWLAVLVWPWASSAHSHYQRRWDATTQAWKQTAQHRQQVTGITVETDAYIAPQLGCTYLTAKVGRKNYTFQATSTFQHADIGVPGWETPLYISTSIGNSV